MKHLLLPLLFLSYLPLTLLGHTTAPAQKIVDTGNALNKYCESIESKFIKYGWENAHCKDFGWLHVRNSVLGMPLIWKVYGDENKADKTKKDTTLVLCGVHGDEITPIKFCFDILQHLEQNFAKLYSDKLILVAPIVNPDSFFQNKPSRTNQHGVDINRNFPTLDWPKLARSIWINRYHRDRRRNPGVRALSEPEVLFQINLIKRYNPDKIISVHAPMTMLDFDGPTSKGDKTTTYKRAFELLLQMSKSADGYKIRNYRTFPGSLGNWAGVERKIPTYTLELPTSDPGHSEKYWRLFKTAINDAFTNDLRSPFPIKEKPPKEVRKMAKK